MNWRAWISTSPRRRLPVQWQAGRSSTCGEMISPRRSSWCAPSMCGISATHCASMRLIQGRPNRPDRRRGGVAGDRAARPVCMWSACWISMPTHGVQVMAGAGSEGLTVRFQFRLDLRDPLQAELVRQLQELPGGAAQQVHCGAAYSARNRAGGHGGH